MSHHIPPEMDAWMQTNHPRPGGIGWDQNNGVPEADWVHRRVLRPLQWLGW